MYYNIYFDIIYNKLKSQILINSANIIGSKIKNSIVHEGYNKCLVSDNKCNLNEDCAQNCNKIVYNDPNYKRKLDLFIKQIKREEFLLKESESSRCYIKSEDGFAKDNKITKKSICDTNKGIWDSPCVANTDCPFYSNNDNRGGCIKNKCQFPWGIEVISPRTYNKESVPLCNGCIGDTYRCCNTQSPPNYIFKVSN